MRTPFAYCKVLLLPEAIWTEAMTATMTNRPLRGRAYNQRKQETLENFSDYGPMNPPAWAVLAGFYPVRAAYTYLARLYRWGLLERRRDARGLLLYRITQRGLARLAWLKSRGS